MGEQGVVDASEIGGRLVLIGGHRLVDQATEVLGNLLTPILDWTSRPPKT